MEGTLNSGNLRFWKNVRAQFFSSCKKWVLKVPIPDASKCPQKKGFGKSSNSQNPNPFKQPLSWWFWHKWEDWSRKVKIMNAVSFNLTPWTFCPVMRQAVRKPCFPTSIPRGQNPRFPDASSAGQTLRSQPDPSPTPGIKYVARSPCCNLLGSATRFCN